jgi:hypothetical protein
MEEDQLPLFLKKHIEQTNKTTGIPLLESTQKALNNIEEALKKYNELKQKSESPVYQQKTGYSKMKKRRKEAKPKKKINIVDALKIALEADAENSYICLAYDELKTHDTIDVTPAAHIEKALQWLSLKNVPKAGILRHALQQELNKRSNIKAQQQRTITLPNGTY